MHACPSCGAPLDDEGICTTCGALARGFFRGLDLGAPQIAQAVARGLDFYRLLGVEPDVDTRTIARRYRQLRVLFPDDPSSLEDEPSRKLDLLELAGRALTDPQLRRTYDELRGGRADDLRTSSVRCGNCAAPLPAEVARCPFCGTPRPAEAALPSAPPPPMPNAPPPAEPVDYYAMLGLTPVHLLAHDPGTQPRVSPSAGSFRRIGNASGGQVGPPKPEDVDEVALARQRQILLTKGLTQPERDARVLELEIARRILRDESRRSQYDGLLRSFRQGLLAGGRLETLQHLQDQARAEIAEERGEQLSEAEGTALLHQGRGYLEANLPREAVAPLRRAVAALPRSAETHAAYARAILASDDPLSLGGHMLRQALASLDALEGLGALDEAMSALAALCRGLLERDLGNAAGAERELRQAVDLDSKLGAAWRALAALALARGAAEEALGACRRALAADPRDQRALLLMAGACLRTRRRNEAHEAAAQIAQIRGEGWTAAAVLAELEG